MARISFITLKKAIGASERVWNSSPAHWMAIFKFDDLILENVSLDIKPESTCAIVGKSGSGKSTLAKILFNFYPIQGGSIALDGNNWAELDYDWLRSNMAMVPQDPELFADTIR